MVISSPEVWLSPRRFGQRMRLMSSHTNYFLLVTFLREKSDSISKLRPSRLALDRLLLASCDGVVQAQRKDFFPLTQWSTTPSNVQRRLRRTSYDCFCNRSLTQGVSSSWVVPSPALSDEMLMATPDGLVTLRDQDRDALPRFSSRRDGLAPRGHRRGA